MKPFSRIAFVVMLAALGCKSAPEHGEFMTLAEEMRLRATTHATSQTVAIDATAKPTIVNSEPVAVQQVGFKASPNQSATVPDVVAPDAPREAFPPVMMNAGVLTLADLESFAMQHNPALSENASRVAAARGNWLQVGLPPNPSIGYSGQQLGSGGAAEQNGGFISQEFIRGNKLGLNQEVASWKVKQAEQQWAAASQRVMTDVRIGFYDVLIAQQRRALSGDLVKISEQGEHVADALFKGDEVSEADPLRAKVEADTARILLQNATNQHRAAWRRLTAILGMPGMPMQEVVGDLNPDQLTLTWQETLQRVLNESPEIGAANAEVEAARWAIQRACAEVVPDVEVQAVVQDDRGTGSTNANLQVTFPLPLWNRNQGAIQQAHADAAAAERAVDRLALQLQSRLASAFRRYENSRNQVHQYSRENGILDSTKRSLELIRRGYEVEEFGVIDLLSAQRTYFETNLAYLDSQQELWVTTAEIQGLLLKGSLTE